MLGDFSSIYDYLQIRIEPYGKVTTGIAIQGLNGEWVTTYLISVGNNGKDFTYYKERGYPKVRYSYFKKVVHQCTLVM
jgi:hypothetical protein